MKLTWFVLGMITFEASFAIALCDQQSSQGSDGAGPSDQRVVVYIEDDFHEEMRIQTPSSADNGMTFEQIRNTIMQAAEAWNLETRGISFSYGGALDINENLLVDFCGSVPNAINTVSIYVHFRSGFHTSGGLAHVYAINQSDPQCDGYVEMTIWDRPENTWTRKDWTIGGHGLWNSNDYLRRTLIHEFGHAIQLGHGVGVPTPSAMRESRNHPVVWDKDCADEYTGGKGLRPVSLNFNSNGSYKSTNWASGVARSGAAHYVGILEEPSSGGDLYVRYRGTKTDRAAVGTDGYLSWSSENAISSQHSDILALDVTPTLFSRIESTPNPNGVLVSFTDDENDSNPLTTYDPPYTQFQRAGNTAFSGLPFTTDATLKRCLNGSCSSSTAGRSHWPISFAYDPVSDETIAAWIDTESFNAGRGFIQLSAGFSSYNKLKQFISTYSKFDVPPSPSNWYYENATDLPVSVSCADASYYYYNCIVAWTDKTELDGSVLVGYFRVSGGTILFDSDAEVIPGSNTFKAPTTGYFNGQLHVAWADPGGTITIKRSAYPSLWTTHATLTTTRLITGPSFASHNGRESTLIYYQSLY